MLSDNYIPNILDIVLFLQTYISEEHLDIFHIRECK